MKPSRPVARFDTVMRSARIPAIWATAGLFHAFGSDWLAPERAVWLHVILFGWLFAAIMWGAFGVVASAERLAHRLGEPYGTLVLTLAVTVIEVSFIVSVMAQKDASTELARDTVFAVLMITLNGVVGLCLLIGGVKHREQSYNLAGAQAFLAVIIPLSTFALCLPNFTTSTAGPTLSVLQAGIIGGLMLALYSVFLTIQTIRHAEHFRHLVAEGVVHSEIGAKNEHSLLASLIDTVLLLLTILPIIFLAEEMTHIGTHYLAVTGAPLAVAGVVIAILVLSPETVTALRAATANQLQRSINVTLGSALATVSLTIPAVLAIGIYKGGPLTMGLAGEEMLLLAVTFVVSILTFSSARTNMLQGAVHLVMFLVFVLLLFNP